jgi:hypothetical protein
VLVNYRSTSDRITDLNGIHRRNFGWRNLQCSSRSEHSWRNMRNRTGRGDIAGNSWFFQAGLANRTGDP